MQGQSSGGEPKHGNRDLTEAKDAVLSLNGEWLAFSGKPSSDGKKPVIILHFSKVLARVNKGERMTRYSWRNLP